MSNDDIDFSCGDFVAVGELPHVTQQAVMPVVAYNGTQFRPLGTCFSISPNGLLLTARHVVDEALRIGERTPTGTPEYDQQWSLGVLYVRERSPWEDVKDLFGGILPVWRVHRNDDLDIAILILNLPFHSKSGEALRLRCLNLNPAFPIVGAQHLGLGYHGMVTRIATNKANTIQHFQSYAATRVVVDEIYFPRRDASLLNFPCFRTSGQFEPGMSGGPIVDTKGSVVGMICSSFGQQQDGGHISFGSLIAPALLMSMEAKFGDDEPKPVFLYDLAKRGSVCAVDLASGVEFIRNENELVIDFGIGPMLRNVIND